MAEMESGKSGEGRKVTKRGDEDKGGSKKGKYSQSG